MIVLLFKKIKFFVSIYSFNVEAQKMVILTVELFVSQKHL